MSIYSFKVALKHRKSLWRKIEIREEQTLGQFDRIIREAFDFEQHDHLSEFFREKVWSATGLGEIEPGGLGNGSRKKIIDLRLNIGDKLEYIYDFGDSIICLIELKDKYEVEDGSN